MGRSCHSRVSATLEMASSMSGWTKHILSLHVYGRIVHKFYLLLNPLKLSSVYVLFTFDTPSSSQMVGVIVRLEKEAFKVLTQHGKELHVPQHTVQKRNNRAVALDMNQVSLKHSNLYFILGNRIPSLLVIL